MSRYVVIQTPNCSVCKTLKAAVDQKGLQDIAFTSFQSKLGQELITKHDIRSGGSVVDTEEDRLLTHDEVKSLFYS